MWLIVGLAAGSVENGFYNDIGAKRQLRGTGEAATEADARDAYGYLEKDGQSSTFRILQDDDPSVRRRILTMTNKVEG